MSRIKRKLKKIGRKLKKFRLRPISVFLFHQVSDTFDESTMFTCDWTETKQFKNNIEVLKKEYRFISLDKAYFKLRNDFLRLRDYAVLTTDDGWRSLKNILPWFDEQHIPVTLFLNPGYFDGIHFRDKPSEKYLLSEDIAILCAQNSNITIGMHGWEHTNVLTKSEEEFSKDVQRSIGSLGLFSCFIPFYAYTWGKHDERTDRILKEFGIVPVLIDDQKNIDDINFIHRELLDGKVL